MSRCVAVCTSVCLPLCGSLYPHVSLCLYGSVCLCVPLCVCLCTPLSVLCMILCVPVCLCYVPMCLCVPLYALLSLCARMPVGTYGPVCIFACTHMHVQLCIHTRMCLGVHKLPGAPDTWACAHANVHEWGWGTGGKTIFLEALLDRLPSYLYCHVNQIFSGSPPRSLGALSPPGCEPQTRLPNR